MRVLHVGKYFPPHPGGIEYVLHDLLIAQRRAGLEVAAVVHNHECCRPTKRGDFHGCHLWRVRTFGTLVYAPLSPSFGWWLGRAIRQFQPDLIHCHVPNTSAFFTLVGKARKLPLVVHWHADVVASRIDRRLALAYPAYRPFEQALLARSRAVVATSPSYLASSQALAPWRDKCHVVPLGVDPDRLSDPDDACRHWAQSLWKLQAMRVLAIGRLTYYKGFEFLLRAMAKLPGAGPGAQVQLCLVGRGDLESKLRALASTLGIEDRVRFIGFADDGQLRGLLATCDCLCMSSIERTEAFGVVLMEAMRYGKPVVAGDIAGSGVGWVVQNNVTGLLVPPRDVEALAGALEKFAGDADLRHRLGSAGERRFRDEFNISLAARRFQMVYETALKAPADQQSPSR